MKKKVSAHRQALKDMHSAGLSYNYKTDLEIRRTETSENPGFKFALQVAN